MKNVQRLISILEDLEKAETRKVKSRANWFSGGTKIDRQVHDAYQRVEICEAKLNNLANPKEKYELATAEYVATHLDRSRAINRYLRGLWARQRSLTKGYDEYADRHAGGKYGPGDWQGEQGGGQLHDAGA